MSVAFTREESAETAAAVELPDRPISSHPNPNLVSPSGLKALDAAMAAARAAYHAAQQIEDLNERRNAVAGASRDMRYFSERLRTAQLTPDPVERHTSRLVPGRRSPTTTVAGRRSGSSGRRKPIPTHRWGERPKNLCDGLGRYRRR